MGADILFSALMVGGVGLFVGIFLSIAGKRFAVEVDEREAEIIEALPGANCGACGYSGCAALAGAIVKGEAPVNACVVGQAPVAEAVAKIMGGEADPDAVRMVAFVHCIGDCDQTADRYEYYTSNPRSERRALLVCDHRQNGECQHDARGGADGKR